MRAGSRWRGWEGEELRRCNLDWKGTRRGGLPLIDSSLSREKTAMRDLQSVRQEKRGQRAHADVLTHEHVTQTHSSHRVIHTVEYGCEGVTGNICGVV